MDQNKVQQMQFLEQNMHSITMQKQAFQMELNETNSALKEIEDSKEDVYKIVGQLMIKVSQEKIKQELSDKKKLIEIRLKNLDDQEENLSRDIENLRKEIVAPLEEKK